MQSTEPPFQYVRYAFKGMMMGGADVIPGVSGGTVALVLGIYERLVAAISHVDLAALSLLRQRRFRDAAVHVDLWFLLALGTGIATGIISLAGLMHLLLTDYRAWTMATFFGLILASGILVARMIPRWTAAVTVLFLAGTMLAYWLMGRMPATPPPGLAYVFFSGMIAICAMILPGISGAFILLILGKYEDITGALRTLLQGGADADILLTIAVFISGCLVGLLGFSKVLRWLLAHHGPATMAVLCGFMIGSLRRIWPFTIDRTPEIETVKHKIFENTWPAVFDRHTITAFALMIGALVFVLLMHRIAHGARSAEPAMPVDLPEA